MSSLEERARRLAQAFDSAFAQPVVVEPEPVARLLTLRCGGRPLAFDLAEVGGLSKARRVSRLPGAAEGLLGITGVRGRVVAVWDLAMLLGLGRVDGESIWTATALEEPGVAFGFRDFEGPLECHERDVRDLPADAARREHARRVVRADETRPVLDVPSLLDAIRARVGQLPPPERSPHA